MKTMNTKNLISKKKYITYALGVYLFISILFSTLIPSVNNIFNYDYFDLKGGQMPPINSDCNYGFTDGIVMFKSLERSTESSFYFNPILANKKCFLRLHSTSTIQSTYLDNQNVTINYGFNLPKGRNHFLIFYTLIFLFFARFISIKEAPSNRLSVLPYVFSIPVFIYEGFTMTNIFVYVLCLFLIHSSVDLIPIKYYSLILIFSFIFPLSIYSTHMSIWFMVLICFINKSALKNRGIQIVSIFLLIPSLLMNKLYSIEFLNNNSKNSLIKTFLPDKIQFNKLPTYLSNNELSLLDQNNADRYYYQILDFANRIGNSAFPAKNLLFMQKSPDIFSSLIISIVALSLFCFVYNLSQNIITEPDKIFFINTLAYGGFISIVYTFIIGYNDFLNHNLKIITGTLREAERIPQLFSTDWRGNFYSAEGAGEIFLVFVICGIYSYLNQDTNRNKLFYLFLSVASLYGLLLTSSSSSIILCIFGSLGLFLLYKFNVNVNKLFSILLLLLLIIGSFYLPNSNEFDIRVANSTSNSSEIINSTSILKNTISSTSNLLNRAIPWAGYFESYDPSTLEFIIGNSSGSISESWIYNETQHNPHSSFLYLLYSYGISGIIFYIYLSVKILYFLFACKNVDYCLTLMSLLLLINNFKSDNLMLFSNTFVLIVLISFVYNSSNKLERSAI